MSDYSGTDLLKVFKDLNISLLNLSPNVIKAWFDTDDRDMKRLLTWLCTSLSKENYISPLEIAEFLELESALADEKYEREVRNIETEYPGIFDVDMNKLEIELLEDEIDLAIEEEKRLDELIKINENLEKQLSKDLDAVTSEEIKAAVELKSSQESCNSLGNKLDEINSKLRAQLEKYSSNLYNFEFSSVPNFINNIDIKEYRENFDNITSFLNPLLDKQMDSVNLNKSIANIENQTYSESSNLNDSVTNALNTMKNRIFLSHQNYVVTKIEVEKAKEMLNYLNKTDVASILSLTDSAYMQMNREAKEETKRRMCGMLDNIYMKLAEHHISQTKFKYAKQELETYRSKLESLNNIENVILKFLSQYFLLNMLYVQEKKDIDNSEQFFRKILHYINNDLQSCATRTEKMNKIIHDYEEYNSRDLGEKFTMIKSIVKILSDEEDFSLGKSLEAVGEFKAELERLENKTFCLDFYTHRDMMKELRDNVNILQSFLICGPTRRIVVVPPELRQVLGEVDDNLKKQIASVKSAVQISSSMKKIPNKWQNYRRQLWMYFYTDQKKLFHILQEIEEQFKKQKSNGL